MKNKFNYANLPVLLIPIIVALAFIVLIAFTFGEKDMWFVVALFLSFILLAVNIIIFVCPIALIFQIKNKNKTRFDRAMIAFNVLILLIASCILIFMAIETRKSSISMQISTCLSSGGCWDYIRNRCEMEDQGYCVRDEADCENRYGKWQENKKYCVINLDKNND